MYIVPIAWLYVTVMMAVAEATNTTGTVLGGSITFLLYGVLPVTIIVYVMGAPARKRAIKARELAELATAQGTPMNNSQTSVEARSNLAPDAHAEAPADTVAPVRKEP